MNQIRRIVFRILFAVATVTTAGAALAGPPSFPSKGSTTQACHMTVMRPGAPQVWR